MSAQPMETPDGVPPTEVELKEALELVLKKAGRAMDVLTGAQRGELASALDLVGGLAKSMTNEGSGVLQLQSAGAVLMVTQGTPSSLDVGPTRVADVLLLEGMAVNPEQGVRLGVMSVMVGFAPYRAYDLLFQMAESAKVLRDGTTRPAGRKKRG